MEQGESRSETKRAERGWASARLKYMGKFPGKQSSDEKKGKREPEGSCSRSSQRREASSSEAKGAEAWSPERTVDLRAVAENGNLDNNGQNNHSGEPSGQIAAKVYKFWSPSKKKHDAPTCLGNKLKPSGHTH